MPNADNNLGRGSSKVIVLIVSTVAFPSVLAPVSLWPPLLLLLVDVSLTSIPSTPETII